MGRSRTGKSTITEVLRTALYKSKPLSIYSQTKQIETKKFFITDKNDGKSYALTVFDTPGFFDISRDSRSHLGNQQIATQVADFMENKNRQVNLIGFVFNLTSGINEQDIETMIYAKRHFRAIEKISALVLTNCEQYDETQRKRFFDEFLKHPSVRKHWLAEFFQQGVLYMGCLRSESLTAANERALYFEYLNVSEMRAAFIHKCIQCEKAVSLSPSICHIM